MKIKLKKYTKINNAKRKSSYIESKLCKKVTIKTTAVKLMSVVNLWQVQVSKLPAIYLHQIAGFCSITSSLVAYNT